MVVPQGNSAVWADLNFYNLAIFEFLFCENKGRLGVYLKNPFCRENFPFVVSVRVINFAPALLVNKFLKPNTCIWILIHPQKPKSKALDPLPLNNSI